MNLNEDLLYHLPAPSAGFLVIELVLKVGRESKRRTR